MAYYGLLDRTPKGRDESARRAALDPPPRRVRDECARGVNLHPPMSICIDGELEGSVSPGTLLGDAATQRPRRRVPPRTRVRAVARRKHLLAKITTVTTAIQKRLIAPSTNSTAISAPEQTTQSTPCARPLSNAPRSLRAAAPAKTRPFERREFVQACGDDHPARRVRAGPIPRELADVERGHQPVNGVRQQAVARPDRQVPRDEEQCRHPRGAPRDVSRRGRRGGQHHRRGHRHPHSEVPAEPAEVGARPVVHSAHPADR